jgi:hypothetical protein
MKCSRCKGRGWYYDQWPGDAPAIRMPTCMRCRGTGRVSIFRWVLLLCSDLWKATVTVMGS